MGAISFSRRIVSIQWEGNDFSGIVMQNMKRLFRLAPCTKDTTCLFQCCAVITLDSYSGSTAEISCEVVYKFDNGGRRPLLNDLVEFTRDSFMKMNDLLNNDEALRVFWEVRPIDVTETEEHLSNLVDYIAIEMDEVYPLTRRPK